MKRSLDKIFSIFMWLFNLIILTATIPKIWLEATIVPIFKYRLTSDLANYRFISLLCASAKIFASILLALLSKFAETLFRPEQIGLRKGFSTSHNVLTLLTLQQKSHNDDLSLYVAFFDFRKAYDTVPRSMLWSKLYTLGVRRHIFSVLKALYTETTARIRTVYGMTYQFNQNMGVRRGCVLTPLLFVLFI